MRSAPGTNHLAKAAAAHDALIAAATGLIMRAAAVRFEVDRATIFRKTAWPAAPAKAKAATVYILTTYLDFTNAQAGRVVGVDRKNAWAMKDKIIEERERDAALDAWLDDMGRALGGRA